MKKTVSINISGLIFNIDEDAYFELKKYLDTIQGYFRNQEGGDDIMADIEARIAEMFQEQVTDRKEVISDKEVAHVISVMGQPEDYIDDEMREEQQQTSSSQYRRTSTRTEQEFSTGPKRFFRDTENRVLGGVCSGLGYYFGVDPVIFRLLFVGVFFFAGTGVLAYIILWIITPAAVTTAEKLQMKGKPVNIDNIRKAVENDAEDFRKKIQDLGSKSGNFGGKVLDLIKSLLNFLINLLRFVLRFVGKALGIFLIVICSLFLVSVLGALLGITTISTSGIFAFTEEGVVSFPPSDLGDFFMVSSSSLYLFEIGATLVLCIPLISLIYAGIRLLFNPAPLHRAYSITAMALWGVGIALLFWSAAQYGREVNQHNEVVEEITLPLPMSDTLFVQSMEDRASDDMIANQKDDTPFLLDYDEEAFYLGNVQFNVHPSRDDSIRVKVTKKARGSSSKEAQAIADNVEFDFSIDSNRMEFSPITKIYREDHFRFQRVQISIYLPVGKTIFLHKNIGWIIYDIDNKLRIYDRDMVNHYWTMTDEGLVCPKCPESLSRVRKVEKRVARVLEELERELEDINMEIDEITDEYAFDRQEIEDDLKYAIEDLKIQISTENNAAKVDQLNLEMQRIEREFDRNMQKLDREMSRRIQDLNRERERINREIDKKLDRLNPSSKGASPEPSPSVEDGGDDEIKSWTLVRFPDPFTFIRS
ncbi:PspC domain-containing protein [bacterium SCSIO 12741]|nr:PspC domain-containing protein [bacterium SCSIO 12741]